MYEPIIYEPIFDNRFIIMVLFMNRFLCSTFVEETINYEPILWTDWAPLLNNRRKGFINMNPFVIYEPIFNKNINYEPIFW